MSAKFDPILEEIIMEEIFEHFGVAPEELIRRLAIKSHEFYMCDEWGVELTDENCD